jgi:hypothetical protein
VSEKHHHHPRPKQQHSLPNSHTNRFRRYSHSNSNLGLKATCRRQVPKDSRLLGHAAMSQMHQGKGTGVASQPKPGGNVHQMCDRLGCGSKLKRSNAANLQIRSRVRERLGSFGVGAKEVRNSATFGTSGVRFFGGWYDCSLRNG